MLGSKEKGSFGGSGSTTLISRDTEIVGDIKFSGNLDVEGVVRGNIISVSNKEAVVRVVDKGRVEGQIRVPSVIINGEIVGDVFSTKRLELASKARVQGNVHYTLVEMAIGAEINGNFKHSVEPAAVDRRKPPPKEASEAVDSSMPNSAATARS